MSDVSNPAAASSGLPIELRLLLYCVRWPATEQDAARIRVCLEGQAMQPFDWKYFLALCEHHRVAPLVYRALGRTAATEARMPAAVGDALKAAATHNAHSTLAYLAETRRLCALLHGAGVDAWVLKGVPLSQQIYGDAALRQVGDIDLLIAPGMEEAADRVLLADIYYRNDPVAPLTPRRRLSWRRHGKDYTYRSERTPFELDLHWRLFRNPQMPGNGLAQASQRMLLGGVAMEVLPAERSFLFLCVHGALDGWFCFKSLVDVAAWWRSFAAAQRLGVIALAREHGVLPELAAALRLACSLELLDADAVSPALQLQAACREACWILDYTLAQYAAQRYLPTQDGAGTVALKRYEFGLRRGLLYRLEIVRRVLLRPRVWARFDLPDALFPLYLLLSPLEWVLFHRTLAPAAMERRRRSRWHRLRTLPAARRLLVAEAFCALLSARAALSLLPARWIFRWMERPLRRAMGEGADAESIRWAVLSVARSSPLRFVCFPQALAAHAMLRRRGVASLIHYGVRRAADGRLRSHTWLEVNRRLLLGGESASLFAPVGPSTPGASPPADS
jgi:Uncharacterised nucleotidyltransferase/Transglutaminase-like superfamily